MKKHELKKKAINGDQDVFGNLKPFNEDHIWPLSKGGSDIQENKIQLSEASNTAKKDKTKGIINDIKFAINRKQTKKDKDGNQHTYGELCVKIENDTAWFEVEPN